MKRIIQLLIIAITLLLSIPSRAQISSIIAEATPRFSTDSGIVRYWKDSIFISCNKTLSGEYVFSLIEGNSASIIQVSNAPNNFESVEDFQILDEYVFFCGTGSPYGSKVSIIGRFKIASLYSGIAQYEVLTLSTNNNLFRLVVYDNNRPHIVAIGHIPSFGLEKGVLIECYYDNSTNDFTGIQHYYSSNTYPIFDDIIVTDNYVVIVADYRHLCLYRCPKNNIAAGMTNNEYHYYTSYTRQPERATATAMSGDTIATSCPAINTNSNEWSNNIYIFDINTMQMIDGQSVGQQEKGNSRDIIYVPQLDKLVVSHYQSVPDPSFPHTELFAISPFATTPYTTNAFYDPYNLWNFCYLDVLHGRYVVSVKESRWMALDISSGKHNCVQSYQKNVRPINTVRPAITPSPYYYSNPQYSTAKANRVVTKQNISVTCQ